MLSVFATIKENLLYLMWFFLMEVEEHILVDWDSLAVVQTAMWMQSKVVQSF